MLLLFNSYWRVKHPAGNPFAIPIAPPLRIDERKDREDAKYDFEEEELATILSLWLNLK